MALSIILNGAYGRMGKAIQAIAKDNDCEILAMLTRDSKLDESCLASADVIIDFSLAEGTLPIAQLALKHAIPFVCGVTGHSDEQKNRLSDFSKEIPIVYSSNFSTAMNLMFHFTQMAAKVLPKHYTIELEETHNIKKKDKPSGTAKTLINILKKERLLGEEDVSFDEKSNALLRVNSIRNEGTNSDHSVQFSYAAFESLQLVHTAPSWYPFAEGALVSAKWIQKKSPGMYSMLDVLGLNNH